MHISEGILSAPVLLGGASLTAVGTMIGLKKLDLDRIMEVSMLTATFFVASLIHVPIGPASIHLVLSGLLGIILGWVCFPAIVVGLLMQAVFFQYGGLMVLGVNAVIMAFPAVLCFYLARPLLGHPKTRPLAGFIAGSGAILLSAICMALALALTDVGFLTTAKITILANIPIMVIEGVITMFIVVFIGRVHPELLWGSKR
ncbi:MAG: cobalt transporter CbiM [Desulfofustis sp.]|nr:cobalt transporter CbiM [Desulfofustis sp.]MBT8345442.1 cobalt transporter CbiM [Desulfofustis sp.]